MLFDLFCHSGAMAALLSAFSALLCALAIPNELFLGGVWVLGFVALIPLYLALRRARRPRQAAGAGALFGALFHALSSYWLFFYKDFAFWTLGTTTIAYAFIYALAALYGNFLLKHEAAAYRPFVFALAWASLEFLKSYGFLGYPWGLLPYSLSALPVFLQTADTTGVYGLSFLLALSSALGAEALAARAVLNQERRAGAQTHPVLRASIFFAFVLSLVLAYGGTALASPLPKKDSLRAILVQQNTDPWIEGEAAALQSNLDLARRAYEADKTQGKDPADLIVFSETSLRRPFAEYKEWYARHPESDPLLPFLAETGAHLLTGAPVVLDWERWEASNSVILISPRGELSASYAKIHPVPFAEAVPLWEYAWFRKFMREVVGLDSGWVMGKEFTVFSVAPRSRPAAPVAFSTPICFEDAFADLCRQYFLHGAELLINLTNDSWSKKQSAQVQHWAIARLRAIENRRTLVRSTNSGLSCVVDPWGRILYEMPQFEARAISVDIPVYAPGRPTLYTLYGDWFAKLCVLLLVCRLIISYAGFKKHGLRAGRE